MLNNQSFDLGLSQSFKFWGIPRSNNKANGAPQLAALSTKSHIGSPEIGRTVAVANAHIAAHRTTTRIGYRSIIPATKKSRIPIYGMISIDVL